MKKIIFVLLLFPSVVWAQDNPVPQVNVRTRVQQNEIWLRWAVNTPMAWKRCNQSGFWVDRYTLVRNDSILAEPEYVRLTPVPLKPQPLANWENIVQRSDEAAIIAQALYGEDFELNAGSMQGLGYVIRQSQDLEQRFSISLYAADKNFDAACMAGWGYRNMSVKKGERYLYRVIPVDSTQKIEMGFVYTSLQEYEPLPKPFGLYAEFSNKQAMLSWDYTMLSHVYNAYFVERSSDGKNYERLPGIPISNWNSKDGKAANRMFYLDSLKDNEHVYYYRVCGINAFGETGPPSDSAFGQGFASVSAIPVIEKAIVNDKGELELSWIFDEQEQALIKGFELNQSGESEKSFKVVLKDIAPDKRALTFKDLLPANYFTISAIGKDGKRKTSFPVLVQPLDSTPPAIPKGLKGTVDTSGLITLSWNRNTETDLLGYKIYQNFNKNEAPFVLNDVACKDTIFTKTIDLKNLNRKIYYRISSVDMRYNQSDLSVVLELELPDVIPPEAPAISGYKIPKEGIEISWINSPSDNVVEHRIYKTEKGKDSVALVATITDKKKQSYVDGAVKEGVRYTYYVTAVKKSGMESKPSTSITVFTNNPPGQDLSIWRLDAVVDRTNNIIKLTWADALQHVVSYEIYKAENESGYARWRSVEGTVHEITDTSVQSQTTYKYMIRAVFENGKYSKTKEIMVKY